MSFTAPYDPLAGTGLEMFPRPDSHMPPPIDYVDVSLESPAVQFQALTNLIEAADAAHPAPFTGTPPWGESIDPVDVLPPSFELVEYMPPPDLERTDDPLGDPLARVRDPFPTDYPAPEWYNDEQYHGLGVPPGIPNFDQPVESGHTQIIRQNPSAEQGWDAWSGRSPMARVARQENANPFYSSDVNRRHGVAVEKLEMPYALLTQQYRDLLLVALKKRGIHSVVIADVPSVPFTEQVAVIDPTMLQPEALIGPEGVLPFEEHGYPGDHLATMGQWLGL